MLLIAPLAQAGEVLLFLTAWGKAEGGTAAFNPLNTTYTMPGATSYNDTGVRNYVNAVQGICATACTIAHNSAYLNLWKDMQRVGAYTAEDLVERNRDALQTWGTDPDVILRVIREIR